MSSTHAPLTNITNTCPPTHTPSDPHPQHTPHKPRISLDQTASPATPASPDTPHSANFVTATSTPASLPRFPETSLPDTSLPTPESPSPQSTPRNPASPPPPPPTSQPANTWTRPTRPVSPNLHLAAAAATRAAALRKQAKPSAAVKPPKPRPAWPAGHTVPKSPNFRTVGKPLSELAARRKAQLLADSIRQKEELERREQAVKQRRKNFAKSRTVPKSPALKGKRKIIVAEPAAKRRFVPNKMPDFGRAPLVRATTKSKAHAQVNREGGSDAARRESYMMKKGSDAGRGGRRDSVRMERTVSKPFGLQGVDRHNAVAELRMMQMEREAEEQNRRRTFRPVAMREEILDGPTFVPRPKATAVTEARNLLPDASERRARTMAFQRRQQERMAEMDREEKRKQMEKEQKELEKVTRMLKETQFKPRNVPKSHYRPDIEPVGGRHATSMSVQRDGGSVSGSQEGMEGSGAEEGTPESWPVVRRSSFFDEVRKSLSPLLWSPDVPASGDSK